MRRLFAALIVVTVAFALVGCGGGDDEAAAPDAPAETPEAPAAGSGADDEEAAQDRSPLVEGYPMPFPDDPSKVPAELLERIDEGQPLFIFYFDTEQDVVDDLQDVVDDVTSEYRGLISTIEYGIADDVQDVVEDGFELGGDLSEADGGLSEDEKTELKKVYRLAEELGILHTPFIILVDREGTIVWMHRGYIDRKTLELEVLYATQ